MPNHFGKLVRLEGTYKGQGAREAVHTKCLEWQQRELPHGESSRLFVYKTDPAAAQQWGRPVCDCFTEDIRLLFKSKLAGIGYNQVIPAVGVASNPAVFQQNGGAHSLIGILFRIPGEDIHGLAGIDVGELIRLDVDIRPHAIDSPLGAGDGRNRFLEVLFKGLLRPGRGGVDAELDVQLLGYLGRVQGDVVVLRHKVHRSGKLFECGFADSGIVCDIKLGGFAFGSLFNSLGEHGPCHYQYAPRRCCSITVDGGIGFRGGRGSIFIFLERNRWGVGS